MSVEAAVIVPIATFIIALIIYFAFYSYDRCILSQDVYLLGFRAAAFSKSQNYENMSGYVLDKADAQLGKKYFGCSKPEITTSESKKKIKVDGKTSVKPRGVFNYFSGVPDTFVADVRGSAKKHNPPKSLRKVKRACDIAGLVANKGKDKK